MTTLAEPYVQYDKIRPVLPGPAEVALVNERLGEMRQVHHPDEPAYGPSNVIDFSSIGAPPRIGGALVLDFITDQILGQYMIFDDRHWAKVIAAWIGHTWFVDYTGTLVSPFTALLGVIAPTKAGKSRLKRIIRMLVRNPIAPTGIVTAPGVRDALNEKRTLLLEEYHKTVQDGRYRIDLQSLMLSYSPEDETLNGSGGKSTDHCIYGPKAYFAQPSLEKSPYYTEDLLNRSFVIRLQPHPQAKLPPLGEDFYDDCAFARRMLQQWAAIECASVFQTDHSQAEGKDMLWNIHLMPDVLDSREREISVPLCMVADRAVDFRYAEGELDERGFPKRARWAADIREACCAMLLKVEDGAKLMDELGKRRMA